MEPTGAATVAEPRRHWTVSGSPTAFMISSMRMVAAEKAIAISGQQHIPVIRFAADGSWLVEPSATQLQAKCKELGLI